MPIHDERPHEPATGPADLRTRLGPVGAVLGYDGCSDTPEAARELEELGYPALWLTGHPGLELDRIAEVVRATRAATVSTGILAADRYDADVVGRVFGAVEAEHPGRFVPGLGGAHGPRPLRTLGAYLDRLDDGPHPVPAGSRILSALGPKMLDLAAARSAGALPFLATPEYTATARDRLGPDAVLAVEQLVVLDTDVARARDTARGPVGFQRDIEGGYARHFARMGFADDEIAGLADRLVEGVVACGDTDAVARRVAEHRAAGADHVALLVVPADRGASPVPDLRHLAEVLPA